MKFRYGLPALLAFIVLVMISSVVLFKLLAEQRSSDMEAEYQLEVMRHRRTQALKNVEISELHLKIENMRNRLVALEAKQRKIRGELVEAHEELQSPEHLKAVDELKKVIGLLEKKVEQIESGKSGD